MRKVIKPISVEVPKIQSINASHPHAANLSHAHVFTSIGHVDGRDYADQSAQPSVPVYELFGRSPGEDHVTATSGDVTSHQGVTYDGTSWYTSDTNNLYKWSAIGATPTPDGSNPSFVGGDPCGAIDTDAGVSGLNHIGDIQYANIGGTGYLIAPVIKDSGDYNPGGIFLFNTDLTIVSVSFSNLGASGYRIGCVAADESKNELYFVEFDDTLTDKPIHVCTLSDAVAGNCTVNRSITLNWPCKNIQGMYKKGNKFYIEWNNVNQYISVFDESGNPEKHYRAADISGPEGIDFSQASVLYWLRSPAGSEGYIMSIDMAAAQNPVTNDGTGRELDNTVDADECDMALIAKGKTIGETGTRIIKFKRTANLIATSGRLSDAGDAVNKWILDIIRQTGDYRVRWYITSGDGQLVETSAGGTTNDIPLNTWVTLAITWERNGAVTNTKIYLDGVLKDSNTLDTWVASNGDMSLGRGLDTARSISCVIAYDYLYGAVLSDATILSITNDPYSMFKTG